MSDSQPPRSPLLSIAASLAATVKCCSGNSSTETTTKVSRNTGNKIGDPDIAQTISPIVKSASTMSTDLSPVVEEKVEKAE